MSSINNVSKQDIIDNINNHIAELKNILECRCFFGCFTIRHSDCANLTLKDGEWDSRFSVNFESLVPCTNASFINKETAERIFRKLQQMGYKDLEIVSFYKAAEDAMNGMKSTLEILKNV